MRRTHYPGLSSFPMTVKSKSEPVCEARCKCNVASADVWICSAGAGRKESSVSFNWCQCQAKCFSRKPNWKMRCTIMWRHIFCKLWRPFLTSNQSCPASTGVEGRMQLDAISLWGCWSTNCHLSQLLQGAVRYIAYLYNYGICCCLICKTANPA